jgi:hypothetical protein
MTKFARGCRSEPLPSASQVHATYLLNTKEKLKSLCLIKHHTGEAYGGRRIALLSFLIWAPDGVSVELHALTILTLVKRTLGPIN